MQDAIKDIFGPMFVAMLQEEMNGHPEYENNERGEKDSLNRRNGYSSKTLKTSAGEVSIQVPRDRDGSFEPVIVPKRKKDVSAIEDKVLSMYTKGMSQRDIADTIQDIYGEAESKHQWTQIFDEIKNRGVEDILFISMNGVSGLEEERARRSFPTLLI